MGRIKATESMIMDIICDVSAGHADDLQDMINDAVTDAREAAAEDARAQIELYLETMDIDVDDWEAVLGEDLDDYILDVVESEVEV